MIGFNKQSLDNSAASLASLIKNGTKRQWREVMETSNRVRSGMDHPHYSVGIRGLCGGVPVVVTGIRFERLQNISEHDAILEGVQCVGHEAMIGFGGTDLFEDYSREEWGCWSAKDSFKSLVVATHGAGLWDRNPWVWVIDFKVGNEVLG